MIKIPTFSIDLDAAPEDRWTEVIAAKRAELDWLFDSIAKHDVGVTAQMVAWTLKQMQRGGLVLYGAEVKAIAKQANVDLATTLFLQLSYELTAGCTSAVVPYGKTKGPLLARTLDWPLDGLKELTVNLDFYAGGALLFRCASWAGFVGVLTGVRPGGYAVSFNHREAGRNGSFLNVAHGLRSAWPGAFLIRHILETESCYDDALAHFSGSSLMAPCYITIAGAKRSEAAVIVRDRNKARVRHGCPNVQTNHDIEDEAADSDIPDSGPRKIAAERWLEVNAPISRKARAWDLLMRYPIRNGITVYSCVMDAARGTLETRL